MKLKNNDISCTGQRLCYNHNQHKKKVPIESCHVVIRLKKWIHKKRVSKESYLDGDSF